MTVKSLCGVILTARDPAALAAFYAEALGLRFERETHGGLAPHFGVDIGALHFGIHPPSNLGLDRPGAGGTVVSFDVEDLDQVIQRLARLGARQIMPPHDEGFGTVATYLDPEDNPFEVVALAYDFGADTDG